MKKNYGRKVVKKSTNRNFIIYTLSCMVIGLLVGLLICGLFNLKKSKAMEFETTNAVIRWEAAEDNFIPLDCPMSVETQKFVYDLAEAYEIDFTLAMAVMQKESSFRADAVSGTNDFGIMQINKINHEWLSKELGISDFLDAEQNIKAGMFILKNLFKKYNEPELVLMAYNMGETGANRLWEKSIYSTKYTEDIMKIQKGFIEEIQRKEGV